MGSCQKHQCPHRSRPPTIRVHRGKEERAWRGPFSVRTAGTQTGGEDGGEKQRTSSKADMVEAGTNTGSSPQAKGDNPLAWLKFNVSYYKTLPGLLKVLQMLLGIICIGCASPALLSGTHWFLFVTVMSFIATLIWFFIYLLSIREALTLPINWLLTEIINTGIITVLYVTAVIVQLAVWSPNYDSHYKAPNIIAGVFGIINTVAYFIGTYLLYQEWRSGSSQ